MPSLQKILHRIRKGIDKGPLPKLQQKTNPTTRREGKNQSRDKKNIMNLKENDIVMCKVKQIEGTMVFLDVKTSDGTVQGTMIFSEVSPGRIRNIRNFIVPNKEIVCKVLRIQHNHPELSLRRVTTKEREEILETKKKEKILSNIIKTVFKDKTQTILKKIKSFQEPADFLDEARENPTHLKKIATGEELTLLQKIFLEKKESEKEVKKTITLKSNSESGLDDIKKTLEIPDTKIRYLGSSKFSLSVKAKNYKEANNKLDEALEKIKGKAKKLNVQVNTKEK